MLECDRNTVQKPWITVALHQDHCMVLGAIARCSAIEMKGHESNGR